VLDLDPSYVPFDGTSQAELRQRVLRLRTLAEALAGPEEGSGESGPAAADTEVAEPSGDVEGSGDAPEGSADGATATP
jgi:hypothetical protein